MPIRRRASLQSPAATESPGLCQSRRPGPSFTKGPMNPTPVLFWAMAAWWRHQGTLGMQEEKVTADLPIPPVHLPYEGLPRTMPVYTHCLGITSNRATLTLVSFWIRTQPPELWSPPRHSPPRPQVPQMHFTTWVCPSVLPNCFMWALQKSDWHQRPGELGLIPGPAAEWLCCI